MTRQRTTALLQRRPETEHQADAPSLWQAEPTPYTFRQPDSATAAPQLDYVLDSTLDAHDAQPAVNAIESPSAAPLIQARLSISQTDDPSEVEAERVAQLVTQSPDLIAQHAEVGQGGMALPTIQAVRMDSGAGLDAVDPAIEAEVMGLHGGGQPMSADDRAFFEPRFGQQFGDVHIHTDDHAAQLAGALQAEAFTVGPDIAFAAGSYAPGTDAGRELMAHELTHVVQQAPQPAQAIQRAPAAQPTAAAPAADALPDVDELTSRIARCIGIWETNRGQDEPDPKESSLDTVAGVHASMATIEQATMPYAITALKRNKELRNQASPPLTLKELNAADARCAAVVTLLSSVGTASAAGTTPDDFIKDNSDAITATGLSDDDVKTMFEAVTLKETLDQAGADIKAKKTTVKDAIDAIPEEDRLGLGESSLSAYIKKPKNWGENRAGWQRKAVEAMPDDVAGRIEAVATSDNGMGLAIPVIKSRVETELAKDPVPSEEEIVKTVAQQNNPNETGYGDNVWKNYQRLYPK